MKLSPRRHWSILEAPAPDYSISLSHAAAGPDLPDDATVNFVLDLGLRIGEVQMATGAGASDVTATILAVTNALGLPQCEVDVIYTSISVSCHRGSDLPPITAVRVVRGRRMDYSRLTATEELVWRITSGRITAEEAYSELRTISVARHPYPRWVATVALGAMAASITALMGGDLATVGLAFFVSAIIDRVGRMLNKIGLPLFYQQVVGGLIATLATAGAVSTSNVFHTPSLVAAAAITVLLSGLGTVSAVQDAITGFNVTAAGRTMEVALMTAGLITGVVIGLHVAVGIGLPNRPLPAVAPPTALELPSMVLAGAATAGFFALACYSRFRPLLVAAAAGAVGAGAYGAMMLVEAQQLLASAVAAMLVGFSGGILARRLRVTPLVVAVSGITPLLPGLATYRGLYELGVYPVGKFGTLAGAIGIGLALAAGVVLGEFLAQPVRTGLGRLERRLAGPRLAGPLRPFRRPID